MQTMTDLSAFNIEISEQKLIPSASGIIKQFERIAKQSDCAGLLQKIEKWANIFCMVAIVLSALYFTPIVISILLR